MVQATRCGRNGRHGERHPAIEFPHYRLAAGLIIFAEVSAEETLPTQVCVAALAVVSLSAEGLSDESSTGRSALATAPDIDAPGGTSFYFGGKAGKARVQLATRHLAARQQQLQEAEPAAAPAVEEAPAAEQAAPAEEGAAEGSEVPAAAAQEEEAPGAEAAAPAEAAGMDPETFAGGEGENSQASYNLKRLNAVVNKIGNADHEYQEVLSPFSRPPHPGGNPGANLKSISHRRYLFEVAFVWELTKETIHLPLGCLQGGPRWSREYRAGAFRVHAQS